MKLFLDLRCFLGRLWMSVVVHLFLSFSLGSDTPSNCRRYKFSTLVGCRHPVMVLQASFSTGSTLCACADLSHTWHAYSAVE